MKKNILIMMMLMICVSAVGFSKNRPVKKTATQKVCVQKSKKTGKCLKYETRKINNNPKYSSKNNNQSKFRQR